MVPGPEDDKTTYLSADEATVLRTQTVPAAAPTVTMLTVRLPFAGSNRLPVSTRLAEFEVTGVIGEGGFGIVYTAYDHSLEREVAIKEYMPSGLAARADGLTVGVLGEDSLETFESGLRSFVNEARLLARFDHPSLLKVYRFWEANGTAYMAMPHYKGETLKQRLKRSGPPDEAWLRGILQQLLAALDVIHGENCFHRDIAPDNIFLVENDRPVLLDFGAARRVISDKTHALTVILKPGFAPLEQYADVPNLKQGAWTDLYALAAVVYQAIAGEKPPPSISRYVSDQMLPLSQRAQGRYSPGFLAAIDQSLSVQPAARPQNAAELRALLLADPGVALASPSASVDLEPGSAAAGKTVTQQATPVESRTVTLPSAAVPVTRTPPETPPAKVAPAAPVEQARPAPQGAGTEGHEKKKSSGAGIWIGLGSALLLVVLVVVALMGGHLLGPSTSQPMQPLSGPAQSLQVNPPAKVVPAVSTGTVVTPPPAAVTAASAAPPPAAAPPPVATGQQSSSVPAPPPPKVAVAAKPARSVPAQPSPAQRVESLVSAANASLSRKDYGQAGKSAQEALKLDPGNAAALAIQKKAQDGAWSQVQIQ